jgi:Zn-finger nucleic acid-binding protein
MNCPVDGASLTRTEVEPGLYANQCSACAGDWLRFGDYLAWRERQPSDTPEQPAEPGGEVATAEPGGVRRCPDCGHLLTRYTIGHGVTFPIDRCGNCNGVWLDAKEWQSLRERGLHDNLHQMFGPGSQWGARTEERERRMEAQFERQLGGDFGRAREFATWVADHPRRSQIMAYVQSCFR